MPRNLVQRWLGHAQLSTTAIYADAVGEEERHIAARLGPDTRQPYGRDSLAAVHSAKSRAAR